MAGCDVAARVLFGPGLNAAAERLVGLGFLSVLVQGSSTTLVIALSAALGALMMLGLAATLPAPSSLGEADAADHDGAPRSRSLALWILNGVVLFVLAALNSASCCRASATPISPPERCR